MERGPRDVQEAHVSIQGGAGSAHACKETTYVWEKELPERIKDNSFVFTQDEE